MSNSLKNLIPLFLKKNNYSFDEIEMKVQMESHPDYPSFRSITDTLDYLEIEHLAASISKEYFNELTNFFLATITIDKSLQICLVEKTGDLVKITSDKKPKTFSNQEFLEMWNGNFIAVEKNTNNSSALKFNYKSLLLIVLAGLVIYSVISAHNSIEKLIYSALTLIGLALSALIVKEDLGINSAFVNKICNASKHTSCSQVIKNEKTKLLGKISFSDLCIIAFSALITGLLITPFNHSTYLIISSIAIPFVLLSIYYQAIIIKKWCLLCLGISTTLILQFITLSLLQSSFNFSLNHNIQIATVTLFIALSWYFIKPLIKNYYNYKKAQLDFIKFKSNQEIFEYTLSNQPVIDSENLFNHNLIFGNTESNFKIIAVTNPLCGYCKTAFNNYEKILKRYGEKLSLEIVFNVYAEDIENEGLKIALKTIEAYKKNGQNEALNILKYWFENKDYKAFENKYGSQTNYNQISLIKQHKDWCLKHNINYTPATIVNNHLFPKQYQLEDLLYLAEDLITENEKISQSILTI